jgi:DNA-binding transcriptional LysR family regulator
MCYPLMDSINGAGFMDIHHLRVFRAAARTSSFTAAGQELSLSQSTVSLHIKKLEEEFGCVLFIRSRKRVTLSDAGRALLPFVDRVFSELKNAELAAREFSALRRGTIRLGTGATTLVYLLPRVLSEYRRKYPLIEIIVTTEVTEVLLEGVLAQTIDLAIVMSPSDGLKLVEAVPMTQEELVIILASDHPLATKKALLPKDLADLVFISHLRDTAMRTVQQDYFDKLGVQPRIAMEMENMEAIKSLVSAGMGAAILPLCCVTEPHGNGVVYKRVKGFSMSRDLFIATTEWSTHPPATLRLANHILRAFGAKAIPNGVPD